MDIKLAEKEFDKYAKEYDLNNENLKRKYYHTYRVEKYCEEIAKDLNLKEEEIQLAKLVGILHDIARFEQYTQYGTFADSLSIDHGHLGTQILIENDFIRTFVKEKNYDSIIIKSIENHNKYKIQENLTDKELLYSKIIRDADKLDIYYEAEKVFYKSEKEIEEIENGIITNDVMGQIKQNKQILRKPKNTAIDRFMTNLCFAFDLNFKYSFNVLQNKDYINKIIDRFE